MMISSSINNRKKLASVTLVSLYFFHSFLSLVIAIYALIVYGTVEINQVACNFNHIPNYMLPFGIMELICFVLNLLCAFSMVIELKLREGFHPGIASQCFAAVRLCLQFVTISIWLKITYIYFSCELIPDEYKSSAVTGLLILSAIFYIIFIICAAVIVMCYMVIGCGLRFSQQTNNNDRYDHHHHHEPLREEEEYSEEEEKEDKEIANDNEEHLESHEITTNTDPEQKPNSTATTTTNPTVRLIDRQQQDDSTILLE
ncbi:hypothetical protein ABK040_009817 [Willaertia magna]